DVVEARVRGEGHRPQRGQWQRARRIGRRGATRKPARRGESGERRAILGELAAGKPGTRPPHRTRDDMASRSCFTGAGGSPPPSPRKVTVVARPPSTTVTR